MHDEKCRFWAPGSAPGHSLKRPRSQKASIFIEFIEAPPKVLKIIGRRQKRKFVETFSKNKKKAETRPICKNWKTKVPKVGVGVKSEARTLVHPAPGGKIVDLNKRRPFAKSAASAPKERFGPRRRTYRRMQKRRNFQVFGDAKKKILAIAGSYNNNCFLSARTAKTMVSSTYIAKTL